MKFNLPNDHFAGWVPCITGHLSFSLFGEGSQFSTYNVPETKQNGGSVAPGRKIAIVQRRLAQDYIVPSNIIYFFKPRIASDFYLVAEAVPAKQPITVGSASAEKLEVFEDELGALVGEIYVSHKYTNHGADLIRRGHFKKIAQECEKFQAEFERNGVDRWDTIQSRIKDMVKEIEANDVWVSTWYVIIFRTGEVRFWPSDAFKLLMEKSMV